MRTTNRRPPDGRAASLEYHFFACPRTNRRFSFQVITRDGGGREIQIVLAVCTLEEIDETYISSFIFSSAMVRTIFSVNDAFLEYCFM